MAEGRDRELGCRWLSELPPCIESKGEMIASTQRNVRNDHIGNLTGRERMNDEIPGQVNLPCLMAREAAEYLGISQKVLWDLKMENLIPHFQLQPGLEIFYPVVGLDLWLENNPPRRRARGGR